MEVQDNQARIIGENITRLRKMTNMTQLELAEKLNYSDKSISKWEQGNGIPDVRILIQISQLFGVTLDDLVKEHKEKRVLPQKARRLQHFIIVICSVGLCWLLAVAVFVAMGIFAPSVTGAWLAFLYAVPASAIVVLVFSTVWKWKLIRILSISVLVWTVLACIYLTAYVAGGLNEWLIFLLGIPLQLLTLFYFVWRKGAHYRD